MIEKDINLIDVKKIIFFVEKNMYVNKVLFFKMKIFILI